MIKFNSTKNRSNKKGVFLCLVFLFLSLFFFWPSSASAILGIGSLVNAVLSIPFTIAGLALSLFVMITHVGALLVGWILDMVTSPSFISLSYTNPDNNPIIKAGLSITQGFVNLLLVVALVYTALSIALKINETDAKKMLARLIIVALLVNFAPVFCGLVVDATNIAMYYFLSPIKGGASGSFKQLTPNVTEVISKLMKFTGEVQEKLGLLMMLFAQIILNVGIAIALFLFAGIFLFRYIAIWTLVILAPIAFAGWVLPREKPPGVWEFLDWILFPLRMFRGFWDKWLEQFAQWSIIGIPMAFFLYLAIGSFSLLTATFAQKVELPGLSESESGFLNESFPYFVVIVFLIFGWTMGLQTGAMGGAAAISFTKRAGMAGALAIGIGARRGASAMLGAEGKEWMKRQAKAKFMPEKIAGMKGTKGFLAKAAYGIAAPITGTYWALRRGIGEAGLRLTEAERKDIKEAEQEYKGTTAERKLTGIRDAIRIGDSKKAAGILRQGIEEAQIANLRELGLTDSEVIRLGRSTLKTHPEEFTKIRDAFLHLAEEMGKGFSKDVQEAGGLIITDKDRAGGLVNVPLKIFAKIKPEFLLKMDKEALENKEVEKAFHLIGTGNKLEKTIGELGRPFIEKFVEEAEKRGIEWYEKNNPILAAYLKSTTARALGLELDPQKKIPNYIPEPPKEGPLPPIAPPPIAPPPAPPRGRSGIGGPSIIIPGKTGFGEKLTEEEIRKRKEIIEETKKPRGRPGVGGP